MKILKNAMMIALFVIVSSGMAHAKYERILDVKINPQVDFSKLDFATVSIYPFEIQALCGDDVVQELHRVMVSVMNENGINAILMDKYNPDTIPNSEFSLDATTETSKKAIFAASKSDIVISGILLKDEQITKRMGKSYLHLIFDVYVYSKSLDSVIFKVHYDEMIRGSNAEKVFKTPFIDSFSELFEIIHPEKRRNHEQPDKMP